MKRKRLLQVSVIVGILMIGFLGMSFLGSTTKHSNKRDAKPNVRSVETQKVVFKDLTLEIKGNGVIESQKTLQLISEATGKVLFAKNNLKSGTFVKEGELIVEVDPTEVKNTLYSLRSDFLNSVASILPDFKVENEAHYQKWFSYFNSLNINEDIPVLPEISDSKEKIKISTRNIFSKFYAAKNQEVLLSKHFIKAPFTGYIESSGIIENSYVSRGQHLFTLRDAVNLEISVPLLVEEAELIEFNKNPSVKIMNDKNHSDIISGRIIRKETNLDRNSQTMNAYVVFRNTELDPYFLPGNYVDVKITGKTYNKVATLARNLISNDSYAFTIKSGKLAKEKVNILNIQGDIAVIDNSIPEDTRFVTTILQKPLIGMEIQSANEILSDDENGEDESLASTDN